MVAPLIYNPLPNMWVTALSRLTAVALLPHTLPD
ncbi:hypothetical protein CLV58_1556 [Spirosoma oryzae]|uniref:Uncharacterized protein n=1 Tax=Spirosoma oryzae TaxID=1469603 RepID=A0A2T0RI06_9BACT|nr:hypothetical protein CLV58_1556 [Spirosoma oryzae]